MIYTHKVLMHLYKVIGALGCYASCWGTCFRRHGRSHAWRIFCIEYAVVFSLCVIFSVTDQIKSMNFSSPNDCIKYVKFISWEITGLIIKWWFLYNSQNVITMKKFVQKYSINEHGFLMNKSISLYLFMSILTYIVIQIIVIRYHFPPVTDHEKFLLFTFVWVDADNMLTFLLIILIFHIHMKHVTQSIQYVICKRILHCQSSQIRFKRSSSSLFGDQGTLLKFHINEQRYIVRYTNCVPKRHEESFSRTCGPENYIETPASYDKDLCRIDKAMSTLQVLFGVPIFFISIVLFVQLVTITMYLSGSRCSGCTVIYDAMFLVMDVLLMYGLFNSQHEYHQTVSGLITY